MKTHTIARASSYRQALNEGSVCVLYKQAWHRQKRLSFLVHVCACGSKSDDSIGIVAEKKRRGSAMSASVC